MGYDYEFDDTQVGDLRLRRRDYETLQEGYRLLRENLVLWNERALQHGAETQPYEKEVADLDRMLEWGDERLANADAAEVVVNGVSVGSLRYAKAAIELLIRARELDRAEKAAQGWPDGALRSLDDRIARIGKISDIIKHQPNDVLWQVIPDADAQMAAVTPMGDADWDVFVSHASEDKEAVARPLSTGLQERGLSVWYDEFTLTIGDSLRRSIDRGLARSRFGVVIVSSDFLRKEWPQKELDGLVAREVDSTKVILPVWHNITAEEIRKYSPLLADRLAASSAHGLDDVIEKIMQAVGRGKQTAEPPRPAKPRVQTDVRVTLRGAARNARFVIENLGADVVRNVDLAIDTPEDKESPLVKGDYDEKLPIEIFRPGARVELLAALTFGTGTTFRSTWHWQEADGRTEKRTEKISLQSF